MRSLSVVIVEVNQTSGGTMYISLGVLILIIILLILIF